MTMITNNPIGPNAPCTKSWHKKIFTLMAKWHHNISTRQTIHDLSAHQLNDIGLSRQQADNEAKKHFWS